MIEIECWRPEGLDPQALAHDLEMLADVLHACVHAGASVNFVLPFPMEEALEFWRDRVLPNGRRIIFVARTPGGRIAGTVQLDPAGPPNQAHRADVLKLLVHPDFRRQGIAKSLMLAAEDHARLINRTLLTLDTRTGDAAEPLYLSLGYQLAGIIPRFSRAQDSPELQAASFYFKELQSVH